MMNIIVTGASSGIGKATAIHLSKAGQRVFATVRRAKNGEMLKLAAGNDKLIPLLLDVTDVASIQVGVDFVAAHLGEGPLALVNNAGIFVAGPLEVIPMERYKQQFDVSLFGVLAVTQAFLPLIRQRPGGRIINIGSMNGRIPGPFGSAYASAKHALRSMTDSLRMELSPWEIGVSLIESGIVATSMMDKVRVGIRTEPEDWTAQHRAWYEDAYNLIIIAMARLERMASQPEDVARTIEQALNARRPRPYYRVGWDAWLAVFAEALLPTQLSDWLILKFYGLEKRGGS